MTKLFCPCCGEIYNVGIEVQPGRKILCGKCQHKHIYYNYIMVPFAVELTPKDDQRRIACPSCRQHFYIDNFNLGEYACPQCNTLFYVSEKPEVFAPGVQLRMSSPETPAAPEDIAIVPQALPPESFTGHVTEPLLEIPLDLKSADTVVFTDDKADQTVPGGNVIKFNDEPPQISLEEQACINVKVGLKRERSGLRGMLINIAEKLCGK